MLCLGQGLRVAALQQWVCTLKQLYEAPYQTYHYCQTVQYFIRLSHLDFPCFHHYSEKFVHGLRIILVF